MSPLPSRPAERPSKAERSAISGQCEQCRELFRGRRDKRFCRDACRTRFGREKRARDLAETMARLARLAGVTAT